MKGSETKILGFMEGADKRFIIPVYQRKYSWKEENCVQLYEDLQKVVRGKRESHFFGSIVYAAAANGSKMEYHIIDGQQRLTTITLLLLAIRNLQGKAVLSSRKERLHEEISQRFLFDVWANEGDRIKLRLVKEDQRAMEKLFGDEEDYDGSSGLTINYRKFCSLLLEDSIPVDDLYAAIARLEVVCISLDPGDNAQLIFESLNSTGLALSEGDKIRNYVLMNLAPREQTRLYEQYWEKIEACTGSDVSGFVRDYLSIMKQAAPAVSNVYRVFKQYVEEDECGTSPEDLLKKLLRYARFYERLRSGISGLGDKLLDDCMYRLNRLEVAVIRPFLMEVLSLNQEEKLTVEDVRSVFSMVESYLFRRSICDVPANSLGKIFLALDREVRHYDGTTEHYADKLAYILLSKRESGRFPDDDEFGMDLTTKQVYRMRGKYKDYLFERLENYGTVETKDVYSQLDNNVYTIEHIMPQHLTSVWEEDLGVNSEEIHKVWLHRLANLTLTGYNPSLSNRSFQEKRDSENGGYRASGLKMNQRIAAKESWGLPELEERSAELRALALRIWPCPKTRFQPASKELGSCTLEDEYIDLTGRDVVRFRFLDVERTVSGWGDLMEQVVRLLHGRDRTVLTALAFSPRASSSLREYFSRAPEDLHAAVQIDGNIYMEKSTSTTLGMSILRRLFSLYSADPMDLTLYLKDTGSTAEPTLGERRLKYWTYVLPILRLQHARAGRGTFENVSPTYSNTVYGYFGFGGVSVCCAANQDCARVDLNIYTDQKAENKRIFDWLYQHKSDIEDRLGVPLEWQRADEYKGSWLVLKRPGLSILQERDWDKMAQFQAEWSCKICDAVIPWLTELAGRDAGTAQSKSTKRGAAEL